MMSYKIILTYVRALSGSALTRGLTACCMFALLSITPMCIVNVSQGKDLGNYGHTFDVKEPDLLSVIEDKLKRLQEQGGLKSFYESYQKQMALKIQNPQPIKGIKKATANKTRKFDPSTILDESISVPDLNNTLKVLYPKGTKINPLDYSDFFNTLIFIDERDQAQKDLALLMLKTNKNAIVVLTAGTPGIREKDGNSYFFYFDQQGIYSKRFDIQVVPSVVFQEDKEKVLTINEISMENVA